jgi:CsoR family transcriptional regulator, copper-sensing transcriptional repressor
MNKSKKDTATALKKAQTSIQNILQMIDEDKYCIDILQQILAVNGLLKSASDKILQDHLHTCFSEGMKINNKKHREKLIEEVVSIIDLKSRTK